MFVLFKVNDCRGHLRLKYRSDTNSSDDELEISFFKVAKLVNVEFYRCGSVHNRMDRKILFQVDVPKIHF